MATKPQTLAEAQHSNNQASTFIMSLICLAYQPDSP